MRIRLVLLPAAALAGCLAAALRVQEGPREAGLSALLDRDWQKAEGHFLGALEQAKEGKDEILYLLAVARQNAGRHDEALAALDRLLEEHPGSPYRMKALFRKADVLAARRDFAGAAALYDVRVEALTDPARRRRLAMIYVEAARERLYPKDPSDPAFRPDLPSAHKLLSQALELEVAALDEEIRADLVACELKMEDESKAGQLLKSCSAFEEKYPASTRLDEVLFARGEALRRLNRSWEAEKAWTRLADRFPASKRAPEALQAAARLYVGEKGRWGNLEDLRRALPILRRLARDFAAREEGIQAACQIGLALSHDEELREEARRELLAFAEAHPRHERAPEAVLRAAELHLEDGDEDKAVALYEDFLRRFPDSPLWPSGRQAIADVRHGRIGRARARKDWPALRAAAKEFVELHAADPRAPEAALEIGAAFKEEKRPREAVEAWLAAARKYAGTGVEAEARARAGELLAEELGEFEAAVRELEKAGKRGEALLRELREPSLATSSRRVFRGGEAPSFRAAARNLEKIRVRLWSLDLRDYFEKKSSTAGLTDLEVAVIAPDREWEVPVPGYRRLKKIEFDVELPVRDPGAYVVTASSGKLESTTAVLVSDLDAIALAGRRGIEAIVQNMKTGERVPAPALALAADGKPLKGPVEGLASKLSFLASAPGGIAFRDLDVYGLPVPPERSPKAVVLTDRGIYGPEDEVRVRVLLRDVQEGRFVPPRGKTYRLEAAGPRNLAFAEADLPVTPHGVAPASFRLPRGLQGPVRIRVYEKAGPEEKLLGERSVQIGTSPERGLRFEFLADDAPVFAGDPIEATGILRDEGDRPLPGRLVKVRTPDDPEGREVFTGPDGTFPVAFRDTGVFPRGGIVEIRVEHAGVAGNPPTPSGVSAAFMRAGPAGVEGTLSIPVLSRALLLTFEDAARLHEPWPAGEPKTVSFRARRADETPVSLPFLWRVVRTDEAGVRFPVASGEVSTDAEGRGAFTFTPREGGAHLVVLSRRDGDGLPQRLQGSMPVFDDREEAKLRILSAADAFEPGRPLEFRILSRLEKGTAFLVVESERVEQIVPVVLEKGLNEVRLGPPPEAARDFTVRVLRMQGNAFHAEARDFGVRAPGMKIEPTRKEYRPGETASVAVRARPGSEVILLVAAEKPPAGIDAAAFWADRPGRYFAAESTAALSFAGRTTELDERVLEAMARRGALDAVTGARIMLPKEEPPGQVFGVGAEPEYRYGGRVGGKRTWVGRGGGAGGMMARRPLPPAEPEPLFFGSAEAGPDGRAVFSFALPPDRNGEYAVRAWAVDGSNRIAAGTGEVRARAPVTAVVRAPESAVEGERTSVVALLTNHSKEDREVAISFGGDVKVRVPARSTLEKTFPWTAAPSAIFALEGIPRELRVQRRPAGPEGPPAGGAFAGATELAPEGEGKVWVRYATGPAALLEGLAEGRDPLTPASDAAARLVARVARHRHAPAEATRRAVMEYRAVRAAGLKDAAEEDASWRVLLYLAEAEAKAAGFEIEPDGAMLKQGFARASSDDVKAVMLFALSRGGEAEYGSVHRLWRAAESLSPRALASVALALQAAGKKEEARAAVARLAAAGPEGRWGVVEAGRPDASNTPYAATALAAFAMAEIDPANPLLAKARAWLLGRLPSTAFERALLALAMRSTPDRSAVTGLRIGGRSVQGFGEIVVDRAAIEPVGEGTYYAVAWRASGKAWGPPAGVSVKRTNRWPALVVEGMPVAAGEEPGVNPPMAKAAAGAAFRIDFEVTAEGPTRGYRILEFPRDTGLRVPRESLRVLIPPQKEERRTWTFPVPAYADAPGSYSGIEVLPAGVEFREGWRMTPSERLAAGRILYGRKRWKEAMEALEPLFEKDPPEGSAGEAARMLAYAAAELGRTGTVVRFFEILKEKSPAEVVPFEKVRAVGRAYAAAGEPERAMQVHAGTCDAYFLQEANLVGTLEGLGRPRRAVEEMKRLLLDYPDTRLNREMLYGLGVKLYGAGKTAPLAAADGEALTRAEALKESVAALERTLAWHPADPGADRVALTLGSALLEAGDHAAAEAVARASAARYPASKLREGFDYTAAFACFGRRRYDDALAICERLEAGAADRDRRRRAALMKAQILHARGDLDRALEQYRKLKEIFPDAERAAAFLEREAISVPETSVLPLARPAEIELEYSGVASAHVRAYKVDLAALLLRRKGRVAAESVEVAGIRPVFEKTFPLEAPGTRRRERQRLPLDLREPGAYVVNVKAGGFFASGLVLRSDLAMSVQEFPDGVVRVNVSNVAANAFAEGVKVTIFGTEDFRVRSDRTDPRGIWEAGGVVGRAVAVAEKDGHVAVHLGREDLAAAPQKAAQQAAPRPGPIPADAFQQVLEELNRPVEGAYSENIQRKQQGVEVQRTKK